MFPNFRLMIAAVAASVVALSCGFGVFAALRVNHEPLARLPAATAPLQLVPDKVAGPALLSASPSPVGEPEIAAAAPDVPAGESAPHESDQTPSAASAAEPEAVASIAEAKTEAAAQPAEPPATRSAALAADDHPSSAAEPEPVPVAAGSATPAASGEAAVAAAGDKANIEKPADATGEPVPAATPNVAALERPAADTDQTAPADQTQPVERTVSTEQAAPVEQTARLQTAEAEQTARAEQSAPRGQPVPGEQIGPTEQTTSPMKIARPNLEDDAADAAPTPTEKIARKKHAKTRVAAKTHRKHHTRVAARANMPDSMFLQPRFVSADRNVARQGHLAKNVEPRFCRGWAVCQDAEPLSRSGIDAGRACAHVRSCTVRHFPPEHA
jgi:hypothetical protein